MHTKIDQLNCMLEQLRTENDTLRQDLNEQQHEEDIESKNYQKLQDENNYLREMFKNLEKEHEALMKDNTCKKCLKYKQENK